MTAFKCSANLPCASLLSWCYCRNFNEMQSNTQQAAEVLVASDSTDAVAAEAAITKNNVVCTYGTVSTDLKSLRVEACTYTLVGGLLIQDATAIQ